LARLIVVSNRVAVPSRDGNNHAGGLAVAVRSLLKRHGGNISHAAREADIDRKYFRKLMKKYEIEALGVAPDEDDD
jgi:hypothetical protein